MNSERRRQTARALRIISAVAASGASAKQIAAETGVVESEIYELRAARRNPRLDVWYALLQRRPDLKPYVDQVTSGQATSEQIQKLIAFFQGRGSG